MEGLTHSGGADKETCLSKQSGFPLAERVCCTLALAALTFQRQQTEKTKTADPPYCSHPSLQGLLSDQGHERSVHKPLSGDADIPTESPRLMRQGGSWRSCLKQQSGLELPPWAAALRCGELFPVQTAQLGKHADWSRSDGGLLSPPGNSVFLGSLQPAVVASGDSR